MRGRAPLARIQSFFNMMNRLRLSIIGVASITTIFGALKNNTFLMGFGVGFIGAALMIAIIALKYG